MKSVLEKDNVTQSEKIQKVFAENEKFKKENESQRNTISDLRSSIKSQRLKMSEVINQQNVKHLGAVNDLQAIIENQVICLCYSNYHNLPHINHRNLSCKNWRKIKK